MWISAQIYFQGQADTDEVAAIMSSSVVLILLLVLLHITNLVYIPCNDL